MPDETRTVQDAPAWHTADEAEHRLARTLRAGPEAIRKEARSGRYIFPNPTEQETVETSAVAVRQAGGAATTGTVGPGRATVWETRLERSDFAPDAWGTSIEAIARTPFKNAPQFEGWDPEIEGELDEETGLRQGGWVDSIDGRQPFHGWAAERFEGALFDGVEFALVEQDPRSPFSSAAARQAAGARPRVRTFKRKDLWHFSRMGEGGDEELAAVVINQPQVTLDYTDPNAWGKKTTPAYQVLLAPDPGVETGEDSKVRSRVYRDDGQGNYIEDPAERRTIEPVSGQLTEIPLVPLYGHRVGFYRGHSPFLKTAWSQIAVANASSDLQNFARELSLVIGFGAGFKLEDTQSKAMGGARRHGRYIIAEDPAASFALHQASPASLKELDEYVNRRADAIRKAHRQLHSSQPRAPITAREVTLEAVYAGSQLELWIRLHEAAWQKILEFMALLAGLQKIGTTGISHDFGLPSLGMERLWDGYIQTDGELVPAEVAWLEAQRHGWIDESAKPQDIVDQVEKMRKARTERGDI